MEFDLTPEELNITVTRGDTFEPFTTKTARVTPTGPEPIVVEAAHAQVRKKRSHTSTLVMELACSHSGDEVVVGDDEPITPAPNTYYWDLEIVFNGGKKLTRYAGRFTVLPDVTEVTP